MDGLANCPQCFYWFDNMVIGWNFAWTTIMYMIWYGFVSKFELWPVNFDGESMNVFDAMTDVILSH